MPWIASHDGEEKVPHQIPRKVDVECVTCGGRMRVWSESSDGRSRHFKHIGNIGADSTTAGSAACESVSESNEHRVWKSWAADALLDAFGHEIDYAGFDREQKRELVQEVGLSAPKSDKERRIGDVVVNFPERDKQLGDGIVVEVQHKNESKDIQLTTEDYVRQGYSVVWLEADDFGESECKLSEVDFRKRARKSVWPNMVPRTRTWSDSWSFVDAAKNKQAEEIVSGDATAGSEARMPPEWHDREALRIWRSQEWNVLFDPPETPNYIAQAAIPRVAAADRPLPITLPPKIVSELEYCYNDWQNIVSDTSAQPKIPDRSHVVVPVSVPEPLRKSVMKQRIIRNGVGYQCRQCEYSGEEYLLRGNGAGRAVCPYCQGPISLN